MASLCNEKNGTKRIAFVDHHGKHRSLRLGKCSLKAAETTRTRIEQLLQDRRLGVPHTTALAEWVARLPASMHERLVKLDLVEGRTKSITVGELVERFMRTQNVKASTAAAYKQCTDSLIKELGKDTPIDQVTPSDADAWRCAIARSGRTREKQGPRSLAGATVAKRTNIAKCLWAKATVWKLVPESPFAHLQSGSQVNAERAHYVSLDDTRLVLAACPDDEWRAIVGLARYAGLRCPSEVRELRWSDIDWVRKLMLVRSPKTAGKATHAVRTVPVSPALQPLLWALKQVSRPDAEHVVELVRSETCNLRTRFERIVCRAGLKPWQRLFQNLRASCATDFAQALPNHEAARFMGHSPLIAASHYLQPSDHNFRAVTGDGPWITTMDAAAGGVQSGVQGGVQSGVQSGVAGRRAPSHALATIGANPRNAAWLRESLRDPATTCETDEWAKRDSNPRRHKPADLQSALVGHLSIRPSGCHAPRTPAGRESYLAAGFRATDWRSESSHFTLTRGLSLPLARWAITRWMPNIRAATASVAAM